MVTVLGNLRFVAFSLPILPRISTQCSGRSTSHCRSTCAATLTRTPASTAPIAVEGLGVISTTVLVAWLTRKARPLPAMAAGVAITSIAWLILLLGNSSLFIAATLLGVALGEALQASRFYEYCSRLAPSGQEGVFMGYAFLPIAVGFLIAGQIGGRLVHYFAECAPRARAALDRKVRHRARDVARAHHLRSNRSVW